ncbi:uncharacterized protein FOMMEDRAFT_157050 [Fomitiporia mediterranea MF3/22]|uniref:uncharacterized protein n=1 Tax=Fomitiporia mediterranea (strain MF3/22) TaxID=694068 RepID=UPI000440950F|nr:uncharacterized protein FOMMEDRAFT_157050 [Fomitiporia mediterranea MF3/22]EJD01911.1 hypothetical protein FOMMEDRAFT_157050 [Fomitiporia mediterranea MF3/22]
MSTCKWSSARAWKPEGPFFPPNIQYIGKDVPSTASCFSPVFDHGNKERECNFPDPVLRDREHLFRKDRPMQKKTLKQQKVASEPSWLQTKLRKGGLLEIHPSATKIRTPQRTKFLPFLKADIPCVLALYPPRGRDYAQIATLKQARFLRVIELL